MRAWSRADLRGGGGGTWAGLSRVGGDPPLVVISPLHLRVLITYFPLSPLVRVSQEAGRNGSFSQNFQFEPDLKGTDNNFEVYFINFICVFVFV